MRRTKALGRIACSHVRGYEIEAVTTIDGEELLILELEAELSLQLLSPF
jgi:hypothetical protein